MAGLLNFNGNPYATGETFQHRHLSLQILGNYVFMTVSMATSNVMGLYTLEDV